MQPEGDLLRDFHTDLSVGDILRRARMRSNKTLEEIELYTKISRAHLVAIEEGRLDDLPGRIYALGFIRSYAEYLGLDGTKILQLLKRQSGKKIEPKPMRALERPISDDQMLPTMKTFFIIFVVFVVIVSVGPYLVSTNGNNYIPETQQGIPPVPDELKSQITLTAKPEPVLPETTATATVATTDLPVTPVPTHPVVLKAIDSVWLEIRDQNRLTVFSRVMSPGEEYWVPTDKSGLVMTLGNAGGLQIIVEGTALPLLGRTGKVVRNVVLDPSALKERLKNLPKTSM